MALSFTSKKEIIEKLQNQMEDRDSTAIHALVFIYNRQSDDEQIHEVTKWRNGCGFKPQDAKRGASLAKWYADKKFFTPKQIKLVKAIVKKYARQIVNSKILSGEIRKSGSEWIW